mmetsp:Transcript_22495/g.46283  ORF Transcript_22495/g.46283 Transcript_22495/m.46283 type:complete len:265 (-) Transcript_22495:365-1159(-)
MRSIGGEPLFYASSTTVPLGIGIYGHSGMSLGFRCRNIAAFRFRLDFIRLFQRGGFVQIFQLSRDCSSVISRTPCSIGKASVIHIRSDGFLIVVSHPFRVANIQAGNTLRLPHRLHSVAMTTIIRSFVIRIRNGNDICLSGPNPSVIHRRLRWLSIFAIAASIVPALTCRRHDSRDIHSAAGDETAVAKSPRRAAHAGEITVSRTRQTSVSRGTDADVAVVPLSLPFAFPLLLFHGHPPFHFESVEAFVEQGIGHGTSLKGFLA